MLKIRTGWSNAARRFLQALAVEKTRITKWRSRALTPAAKRIPMKWNSGCAVASPIAVDVIIVKR